MNMNKNKQLDSLTDEHLEDILKTSITNMVPECEKLIADKKYNLSH
jgi:hypothetical protein